MDEVVPLFKSHYSLGRSILTLEDSSPEPDEADSIFDICKENNMEEMVLIDHNMSGFLQAYQNSKDLNIKLIFGVRLTICNDMEQKDADSLKTNNKIVILLKNEEGYKRLIKIFSKASRDGFYYQPRIDHKNLKKLWSNKDLAMVIPFYDSYLFNNTLHSNICVPEFDFAKLTYFMEDNNLPFDHIVKEKVISQAEAEGAKIQKTQSIFYKNKKDFKAYLTFRCINNRSTLEKPEIEHMTSDEFCVESWKEKCEKI
jgi:DNA polymerase-3 subunit alpha